MISTVGGDVGSSASLRHGNKRPSVLSEGTPSPPPLGEPFFADEVKSASTDSSGVSVVNATAQLGITTYLHCRVNSLGGKMVSYSFCTYCTLY